MGEVKQETSPKNKSQHLQQISSQETELLSEQSIVSGQSNPIGSTISRISNISLINAHAAMLNRAPASQQSSNRHLLLQLQRQYGNNYVHHVVQQARQQDRTLIQTKLTLGAVGDKYEQEADRIAKQVVNSISSTIQQPVQRMQPEEEELAQRKPIQRMATGDSTKVDSSLENAIQRARGSGQSLAENVRVPMEQAFGADFSSVRIHTDSQSHEINQSIQAKAFTTAKDIFFRLGAYEPGTRDGQELIAHELTHVVQQNAVPLSKGGIAQTAQVKTPNHIQRVVTQEQVSSIVEEDEVLSAHFEEWGMRNSTIQQTTSSSAWNALKQIARREKVAITNRGQEVAYEEAEVKNKLELAMDLLIRQTLEAANQESIGMDVFDTKKRTELIVETIPNIGKATFEIYKGISPNNMLLFGAHGFTKKNHIQQMLSSMASWEEGKILGFMVEEFETLLRGPNQEQFIKSLRNYSQQLEQATEEVSTKGVEDSVAVPHTQSDVISKEVPELIEQLSNIYDIAIYRDWKWDAQLLGQAANEKLSPMVRAYGNTVPVHILLSTPRLEKYKKVLLMICRTGWSKSAGGGMGGFKKNTSLPQQELQYANTGVRTR
jgi:Domain of unknown function (DUF4157)